MVFDGFRLYGKRPSQLTHQVLGQRLVSDIPCAFRGDVEHPFAPKGYREVFSLTSMFRRTIGTTSFLMFFAAFGCKRSAPTDVAQSNPSSSVASTSVAEMPSGVSAGLQLASSTNPGPTAAPDETQSQKEAERRRIEKRKPVVLSEAAQKNAKIYVNALGAGRRATKKKDWQKAEEAFDKCLQLVPEDARARAERGYAKLLQGQLDEAKTDFDEAMKYTDSTSLLQQIAFNLVQVAKQKGDEKAEKRWTKYRKDLAKSHRVSAGVTCTFDVQTVSLVPFRTKNLSELWPVILKAHGSGTLSDIKLSDASSSTEIPLSATNAELWKGISAHHESEEGNYSFTTSDNTQQVGHVVFKKNGEYFLYAGLSVYWPIARCPYGDAEPSVLGGGGEPLRVEIASNIETLGYMCENKRGKSAPCGTSEDEDETPVQSFCAWSSLGTKVYLLDINTFEAVYLLEGSVSVDDPVSRIFSPITVPVRAFTVEYALNQMVIDACGKRRIEPYPSTAHQ
jgi:tetratricopeptide (TPR) repeat protein